MTTATGIDTTRSDRPELIALIAAATVQLAQVWATLTTAQTTLLRRLARLRPGVGNAEAIRHAVMDFNGTVGAFERDARALAERWAAKDLPTAYRDGAMRALAMAKADISLFTWTTNHQAAVTSITAVYWGDLIRRITEAVRRAQAFARAAAEAARQPTGADPDTLLSEHPLDTVVYGNQARHPAAAWARAAFIAQAATTANRGAINTARYDLNVDWVEIQDGPECVMPGGRFLPHGHLKEMIRSWFSGPAYSIHGRTATGPYLLTVGPNHPVLTTRGWVRAHLLREGDQLVHDRLAEDPATRAELHLEEVPLVEDVYAALVKMLPLTVRATSGNDLHGDGQFCQGEVDVVSVTGSLLAERDPTGSEHLGEGDFVRTDDGLPGLVGRSSLNKRAASVLTAADRRVSCAGTFFPGVGPGIRMPQGQGIAPAPADLHVLHGVVDLSDTESQQGGYLRRLASVFDVEASYLLPRQQDRTGSGTVVATESSLRVVSRAEDDAAEFTLCNPPVGSAVGLPQRISLSKIDSIVSTHYEGWVYDASTSGGTYTIDGVIIANCGWVSHDDPDHAAGTIRSLDDADAYPIAHPGCIREVIPRPDLTGRLDITSGDSA